MSSMSQAIGSKRRGGTGSVRSCLLDDTVSDKSCSHVCNTIRHARCGKDGPHWASEKTRQMIYVEYTVQKGIR